MLVTFLPVEVNTIVKSAVESLSSTRVRLTVEVPFGELKPSLDAAYKKVGSQVRIPGFRPGKVPAAIIDQRIGRGVVLEEAVNEAIPRFYGDAVRENNVEVIGQPQVDVTEFTDGQQLVFTAEVDVRPEIALPDYAKLPVSVEDADVTDEHVGEQLSSLRDRFATLEGVERPVESGDYVSIDLAATVGGEAVEDATANGLSYEVGSGNLLEGLDEALLGRSAGETTSFATQLKAGPHGGDDAEVTVTVNSVKTKNLPALDDDFAQTASEFDTLDALKADITERLARVRRLEQGVQARDKALETLLERTEVPLPESVVDAEVEWRRDNMAQQLAQIGMDLATYLEMEGRSEDEFTAELQKGAQDAVKAQFVLDAIAEKEELEVSEPELIEHIVRRAQQSGMQPQDYYQRVMQSGQLGALVAEVRRGKALAVVLEGAEVTDASGRPVDLKALDEDADAVAAAAEGLEPTLDHEGHDHEGHDHDHEGHDHEGHDHG